MALYTLISKYSMLLLCISLTMYLISFKTKHYYKLSSIKKKNLAQDAHVRVTCNFSTLTFFAPDFHDTNGYSQPFDQRSLAGRWFGGSTHAFKPEPEIARRYNMEHDDPGLCSAWSDVGSSQRCSLKCLLVTWCRGTWVSRKPKTQRAFLGFL